MVRYTEDQIIYNQALQILNTWKADADIQMNIHNRAASYYWRFNKIISIPLLAMMAVSGTTILATISSDPNDTKIAIASGVLATTCAFIQALLGFLGLDTKEATHTNIAKLYQQVLDETETFNLVPHNRDALTQFLHHIDVIRKIATTIKLEPPRSVIKNYARQLIQGNIMDEIRKLSLAKNASSNHQHTTIPIWMPIDDVVDGVGDDGDEYQKSMTDVNTAISSHINHRTNYWSDSIQYSLKQAQDNIYNITILPNR